MKIIHCADIHLGSKLNTRLPNDKTEERKREVLAAFNRLIEYAKNNEIKTILLSGDVFDSDRPFKKDKSFFYNSIKENPSIDFYYLRGNHDSEESMIEEFPNLKTFSQEWITYEIGNITISGIEISDENKRSMYNTLSLNDNKTNIVMLHGDITSSINLNKLKNKYIDYLALGHIHSYKKDKLDERGNYCYSGCLEGRGFDEFGPKGFVVLEIDERINTEFIPFSKRVLWEYEVNISDAQNYNEVLNIVINNIKANKEDIVQVILVGEINFDNETIASDLETMISDKYYFVNIKDKTVRKYDINDYIGDVSLKGEFIRVVLASNEDERTKQRIITLGLKALNGEVE